MRSIFKRRPRPDPGASIAEFWGWWVTARPRAEAMIDGSTDDDLVAGMHARVAAIHPALEWEFGRGRGSRHVLVVSAAGDPELRSLAERWRRASPPPDATFGYASARLGDPDALDRTLVIADVPLELTELRFATRVDEDADAIHVHVWHPKFPDLPAEARTQVTFLALDRLLGEDTVEIWIGEIRPADGPGGDLTGGELATLVAAYVPADDDRWRNLAGERRGRPALATTRSPLRSARWPGLDLHVRVDVQYLPRPADGLPGDEALAALRELEDRILAYADGAVLVAHETHGGVRAYHLYADRPAAADAVKPLLASWGQGSVRFAVHPDPRWAGVAHLS